MAEYHAGIVLVSPELFLDRIGMGDAVCHGASYDPAARLLLLHIEHEKMPIVPEGERPREVQVIFVRTEAELIWRVEPVVDYV